MKIITKRIHLLTSILVLVVTSCAKSIDFTEDLPSNNSLGN
ncbi:hypothetical protein [Maribacter sp. ACAM166]|nr:hypothetical protein [Maribacter sp. ACAM166]